MSADEDKSKYDLREIVFLFLAIFLVCIYLFRGWQSSIKKNEPQIPYIKNEITEGDIPHTSAENGSAVRLSKHLEPMAHKGNLSGEAKQVIGIKIDINKAAQSDFESLPGIGPSLARRIIEKRDEVGGFKSVEDIKQVKGIGDKKFGKIRELIDIK
ncbi:TPA: ComEA family DNA-binding protein [Candidatus Woesearchaeota archaeon]|nr:MAG: hypothetical protein A2073_03870 [Deltaproteobacteria bacterium GWC2_42_11]HIJ03984.1 ComEA family DNA-binding protein [Candidatus Woesearchaeota archaeon]